MVRNTGIAVAASLWAVFLLLQARSTLAWWPFSSSSGNDVGTPPELQAEGRKRIEAQPPVAPQLAKFEVANAEKKFLVEAQKYMESMSPLERCHHVVRLFLFTVKPLNKHLAYFRPMPLLASQKY